MTSEFRHTVVIDFDGVIHTYPGWCNVINEPIEGAFDAMREIHQQFNLVVNTARRGKDEKDPGGICAIPGWFEHHQLGIPTYVEKDFTGKFWNNSRAVLITNTKLPAVAYIDDRGIRFHDWEQARKDLAAFANYQA